MSRDGKFIYDVVLTTVWDQSFVMLCYLFYYYLCFSIYICVAVNCILYRKLYKYGCKSVLDDQLRCNYTWPHFLIYLSKIKVKYKWKIVHNLVLDNVSFVTEFILATKLCK